MAGDNSPTETTIGTFLLDEFRREIKAEIDRWNTIEDKANRTFSFSSSVTAILVGIFSLGESLVEQGMPSSLLLPFITSYCIGVLLFAVSAVFALRALAVARYKKPYLKHSQSALTLYLSRTAKDVEEELVSIYVGSLESLIDKIETKAESVKWAQYIVLLAVASIIVSMIFIVVTMLGWVPTGV